MPDNLIERVAMDINAELHDLLRTGSSLDGAMARGLSVKLARKAVMQMRYPSNAMVEALQCYDSHPVSLYERAIDAALADG